MNNKLQGLTDVEKQHLVYGLSVNRTKSDNDMK